MKRLISILLVACLAASAYGRLGETEAQMVARFGRPIQRTAHWAHAQGKRWELGPSFLFKQEDWTIRCDLVDGRCVRISYGKRGEWTEEQVSLVLSSNSQGQKWAETTKPGAGKMVRSWRRNDGATAQWVHTGGMDMVVPAYEHAKQVVEAKAKAEVSRKPKI